MILYFCTPSHVLQGTRSENHLLVLLLPTFGGGENVWQALQFAQKSSWLVSSNGNISKFTICLPAWTFCCYSSHFAVMWFILLVFEMTHA
jgi:hypothetical protein